MEDNIDNLLDDLDALITNKSPVATCKGGGSSLPYKVPHRPTNEKSPTQLNNPNPKNKFAISPAPVATKIYMDNPYVYASENVKNESYPTSSSSKKKDVESIDSLLELLDEPSPSPQQQSQSQSTPLYSSHNRAATNSSSFQSANNSLSSSSTSSFPSFNNSSCSASTNYASTPMEQKSHKNSDKSFDSLLSDINSSLPDVSSNTMMSESLPQAQPSKPLSLLQPPPQGGASGAGRGGRCSRVVIAGSDMSRGVKSSAFSKSACDRLRCLKCNFEAIQFPGKAWTSAVDYMFFRNNMPNKSKLEPELVSKPAAVAYCCQCSWISADEELTLSPGQTDKPQWVCAGH